MNVYSAQLKCQWDAVWHCDVSPVYFGKALLQRLICKWLSCDDGFVVRRVESLVVLTDVAGRCCNYWGKKKKKVNLVTSRALNPCVCVCVCVCMSLHQFKLLFSPKYSIHSCQFYALFGVLCLHLYMWQIPSILCWVTHQPCISVSPNVHTRFVNLDTRSASPFNAPANQLDAGVSVEISADFSPISSNLPSCMLCLTHSKPRLYEQHSLSHPLTVILAVLCGRNKKKH